MAVKCFLEYVVIRQWGLLRSCGFLLEVLIQQSDLCGGENGPTFPVKVSDKKGVMFKVDMMVTVCNHSSWEAEARGPQV